MTVASALGPFSFIQKHPLEVFCKKRCSWTFCKIHRKTPVPESLFNKVPGLRPTTLLKKDSSTGVFLRILRDFLEHLFYRTPLVDCFYSFILLSRDASIFCIISLQFKHIKYIKCVRISDFRRFFWQDWVWKLKQLRFKRSYKPQQYVTNIER